VADDDDIVARVTSSAPGNSLTALAAYIAQSCGHVSLDARALGQGYRFYPEMGDEIPAFFNRRFTTGSSTMSVTLQGGLDANGEDPFADCTGTSDARRVVESADYHASHWRAFVTVGSKMYEVSEVADPQFIAKHPSEFRIIAEELLALGAVESSRCDLCEADSLTSDRDDDLDLDADAA
jgi:hypothetical protein